MGKRSERVGVPLKKKKIALLILTQQLFELAFFSTGKLSEEGPNGIFARMPEWRVANIVGQAAGSNYRGQFVFVELVKVVIFKRVFLGYSIAHRFAQ